MTCLCERIQNNCRHAWLRFTNFWTRLWKHELGANLYDRETGNMIREKLRYKTWVENGIMYSKPLDYIDYTHAMRRALKSENISSEHENNSFASALKIPEFVDFHKIHMDDFEPDNPNIYRTFNDFFIREVKPGRRPVASPDDASIITSAADCRLSVFSTVKDAHKIFIKGKNFDILSMVSNGVSDEDQEKAAEVKAMISLDKHVANFRLAPMDYHRFHSPVAGTIKSIYHIDGEYFTVQPKALESNINVLGKNARSVLLIDTGDNGMVIFIPIGAEAVGKINIIVQEGQELKKGDEIGYFDYGGSDILTVFTHDVTWDDDLFEKSNENIETLVKVNTRIGQFTKGEDLGIIHG